MGLSGCRVQPELYLACGISGANFHTIGMEHSKCVAAVNTDPAARIFELAHIPFLDDVNHFLERFISHLTVTGFRPDVPDAEGYLNHYLKHYQAQPS